MMNPASSIDDDHPALPASARRSAMAQVEARVVEGVLGGHRALAVDHEPHVHQRERDDADEQREQHQPVHLDVAVGAQHRRLLVQAAPQLHAEVHERDLEHGEQGEHGAAPGPLLVAAAEAAHREVADVGDEQERRGGQAGVPLPEHAPRQAAPQRPGDERDAHEQHADLGAGAGEAVPRRASALPEQVDRRGDGGDDEGEVGEPRRRDVDVEDAHRLALVRRRPARRRGRTRRARRCRRASAAPSSGWPWWPCRSRRRARHGRLVVAALWSSALDWLANVSPTPR